jgi:Tfp pilus assembly protein PilF
MLDFSYVNSITHALAKPLSLCLLYIAFTGCQSFHDPEKLKAENDLLEAEMSIVVNHLNQANPQKAHVELRALLQKHPEHPKLLNLMGLTHLALRQPDVAAGFFRQAYDEESETGYLLNLSSAQIEANKPSEALKTLRSIKTKDIAAYAFPDRINHNMGFAYEKLGRPKLAIKYYKKALTLNPGNYMTLIQISRVYEKSGENSEARNYLLQAKQACEKCFEPVRMLAIDSLRKGDKRSAIELLTSYVESKELEKIDRANAQKFLSKLGAPPKSSK